MKQGRELDALVAEKIFEKRVFKTDYLYSFKDGEGVEIPDYSTDIADAWQVVEKMQEKGFGYSIEHNQEYPYPSIWFFSSVPDGSPIRSVEELEALMETQRSLPCAICSAALKALEVEKSEKK